MNKMTLERFREIKERIKWMMGLQEGDTDLTEEEIITEYNGLLKELLSSDLSDIPFEEWRGMSIAIEGLLDFSKTHANLDFALFDEVYFETIDIRGCNVKNLQYIDYDEDTFDQEFKDAHPEFFPVDLPDDIKKAFYEKKILIYDLIKYPQLRKYVTEANFGHVYNSISSALVKKIGIDNLLKLIEAYPELTDKALYEERDSFGYPNIAIGKEPAIGENPSYEEARRYFFYQIVNSLRSRYGFSISDKYHKEMIESFIPQDLIDMFPNVFIKEGIIPERVLKDYYSGQLTIYTVRYYYDILKDYDIALGTKDSGSVRVVNKVFGSLDNYLEQIPSELDYIFEHYFSSISYSDEEIKQLQEADLETRKQIALFGCLNDHNFYYNLEQVMGFLKITSIEDITNEKMAAFINKVGLDKLIAFNKQYEFILEVGIGFTPFERSLLAYMVETLDIENIQIESIDDIKKLLDKTIEKITVSRSYELKRAIAQNRKVLSKYYGEYFVDEEKIKELIPDIGVADLENLIEDIENALTDNVSRLFDVINKYPQLMPIISKMKLRIDPNHPNLKKLLDKAGVEKFLLIYSKLDNQAENLFRMFEGEELEHLMDSLVNANDLDEAIDDAMYSIITSGKKRPVDVRKLSDNFKRKHPELFLPEDAPEDLQYYFYGRINNAYFRALDLLDIGTMQNHYDWIPYLKDVDLVLCLEPVKVTSISEAGRIEKNLIKELSDRISKDVLLKFFIEYGSILKNISRRYTLEDLLKPNRGVEETLSDLLECFTKGISKDGIMYNESMFPEDYRNVHPELFLPEDAPETLRNLFYQKEITPSAIADHSEWLPYLINVDIKVCMRGFGAQFYDGLSHLDKKDALELLFEYGKYVIPHGLYCPRELTDLDEIRKFFGETIVKSITSLKCTYYDEDIRPYIGEHDEFLLDEDAPEELKQHFYNRGSSKFTFDVIKAHREWLPYLKGKYVIAALLQGIDNNSTKSNLKKLFEKYGNDETLRMGLKNPDSVMYMLGTGRLDKLCEWYDRLHFVPHHIVMIALPTEYIDRFIANGRLWSQLMRLESFNNSDENIESLLKASVCFGVFDGDKLGFNKIVQLFSGIPKLITEEEYNKAYEYCQLNENELDDELLPKYYVMNSDGDYVLTIDVQQNKDIARQLRVVFEHSNDRVLSPDKAHKLFTGFDIKYDPSFRDFILENMDEILTSDEYISYIPQVQRQWIEIKKVNANRVLTLELAVAFVKSNAYEGIEYGNSDLADEVKAEGYDQASFEILQQLFNYGKLRTFSSIPRIEFSKDGYQCEIVRLDSPLPLVIGPRSDCCQRLHGAADTSMEHSMVSKHGRLFVITDSEGTVAQSWVWRNKNVICFDNIEIPDKAFNRARAKGLSNSQLADIVYELYRDAAEELIRADQEKYRELLQQGLITEEQYQALVLKKVTVGLGYNDVATAIRRTSEKDNSIPSEPIKAGSPVLHDEDLYISDSRTQYVVVEDESVQGTPSEDEPILTVYHDEIEVYDDSTLREKQLLMLNKLEIATKEGAYEGTTQVSGKGRYVTEIAWNYGLNPNITKVIVCPTYAIIYAEKEDEIVLADLFYNMKVKVPDDVDAAAKIIIQIRLALEHIKNGKKFNTSMLDDEQMRVFMMATNLDHELDEERGLSHGNN